MCQNKISVESFKVLCNGVFIHILGRFPADNLCYLQDRLQQETQRDAQHLQSHQLLC